MPKITFLGDIMFDYNMSRGFDNYTDSDGNFCFDCVFHRLRPLLVKSDYVLANLETPITKDKNNLTHEKWEFNSPIEFAESIKRNGINFVSTANNHCLDRGYDGLKETITCLDQVGLEHCGTQIGKQKPYSFIKVGSTKVGIIAYTYGTNAFSNHNYLNKKQLLSVNLLQEQEEKVKQIWNKLFGGRYMGYYDRLSTIAFPENKGKMPYERKTVSAFRKALIRRNINSIKKQKPDIIIAYLHIGGQYNKFPSDYTKKTTNWFIKHGCDIVIDNHEHVIHGVEYNNGKLIAYALGNCSGSAGVTKEPYDRLSEYSVALHVYYDNNVLNKITYSILKTIINEKGQYEIYPSTVLYENGEQEEKEKLEQDISQITKIVFNQETKSIIEEYDIINY